MTNLKSHSAPNTKHLSHSLLTILIIPLTVFLTLIFATNHPNLSISTTTRPHHLPLTTRDTITNRCLLSTTHNSHTPCRPLLGHVTKRFRSGTLPLATQVVISDAYRFAYIKTRKTAGTTIFYGYLRKNICRQRPGDLPAKHFWNVTKAVPVRRNCSETLLSPALERADIPPPITDIPLEKLHNYFVFTAARNPYERAVSSYQYCELRRLGTFRQFCAKPLSFGYRCPPKHENHDVVTKANVHWDPQLPELCDTTGSNCVVDYVVDTANMTMMMDEVVEEINRRRNRSYPPLPRFSDSFTDLNVNHKAEEYARYYAQCPECEHLIRDYYIEDVSMFGYEFPY